MYKIFTIMCGLSLISYFGAIIVRDIQYERDIGGHLKLAADANDTELAERKLKLAVDNMEAWSFCNDGGDNCFTSIIYRTPEEDVGYWRENIESTLADLESMSEEERDDNLIESNQLIKVRETLLDSGSHGDHVTQPSGISRYPQNANFALWALVSTIGFVIGATMWSHESRSIL